jgi:hypothetical protein
MAGNTSPSFGSLTQLSAALTKEARIITTIHQPLFGLRKLERNKKERELTIL